MPVVWVLEDQLTHALTTLASAPDAPVLLIESARAFSMQPYHPKRLTFLISAMRHFAAELAEAGRVVHHHPVRPDGYLDSLSALRHCVTATGEHEFWVVEPSDFQTRAWLETLPALLGISIRFFPNTQFLTDRATFKAWADRQRSPVMEVFYRQMRVDHRVLMDGDAPAGGEWNLDRHNRKPLKATHAIPPPATFPPDETTRTVMREVRRRWPNAYGNADGFDMPVTRTQALAAFNDFLDHRLPNFGAFEDAMVSGEPFLYHSFLSAALNAGLLRPMEMIRAAEGRYRDGRAPLNSVEGFVRQILGWREYVYGIYWAYVPEYRERNARNSTRPLPQFMWTGDTSLNCLKQCVGGVIEHGYGHHIQRLMVICNFATLAGLNPQAVRDWFLAMYVDSHDWVVTPNVVGMAMNADGGTIATKPYVSSAAYIDRMSDYCRGCRYSPKERTGDDACPFNFLYWTFLSHFRRQFDGNARMKMILTNLDKIRPSEMREMMLLRKTFIESLA